MIIFVLQANAIGRSAKTVREFLEKHYTDEVADSDDETIKLAIKALLEVSSLFSWVFFSGLFRTYIFYWLSPKKLLKDNTPDEIISNI